MTTRRVVKHAMLTGCAVVGLVMATASTALGALTLKQDDPEDGLRGTYTNDTATVHFRSFRSGTRVIARVNGADGTALMTVKGDRKRLPRVMYAGIRISNHGDFSDDERAKLRALRLSPQALA